MFRGGPSRSDFAGKGRLAGRLCGGRPGPSGRRPNWAAGCKAEFWYWGFAAGMVVFALTLNFKLFFAITAASILLVLAIVLDSQKRQTP